jgi:hypothetical protein
VRRSRLRAEEVAVLHLEPCGSGEARVWTHDGPLIAFALHPRLRKLAEGLAPPHRAHGMSGAWVARQRRWPAIALGALPEGDDTDAAAIRRTVDVALQLVARLDADLAGRTS